MNAAFVAARKADSETLKSLLESADKNQLFSCSEWHGNNVLHEAVIANNVQCVRLIVDAFPLLTEQVNYKKRTPLHLACYHKVDLNIIKFLCKFKNTLNMKNKHGQTALFEAVMMKIDNTYNNNEYILNLIKILIENGADINETGVCGFTILHEAVISNKFEEFKLLLNYGVKIDTPDDFGRNVLHIAARSKRCDFFKFIIEKDPKLVHVLDDSLTSVLLRASDGACENCVELLLQNNADISSSNNSGQTCIELAIVSGNAKKVSKLLEYGADPLVYSKHSFNVHPLIYCCVQNYTKIVEILLNHESINKYIVDEAMGHPLSYGVQNANPKILKLLLNYPPFLDKSLIIDFPPQKKISSGLVGYLLYSSYAKTHNSVNTFEGVFECCEILLRENFPLNHANASVSALTSLLLPFTSNKLHDNILEIVKLLIQYGCNVYDMAFSNSNCKDYSINIELRNELQIPDALAAAFMSGNEIVTKYLLRYWPQTPILLLLATPKKSPVEILKWFKILIEFGWPTGNKFSRQLEELANKKGKSDENIKSSVQNPSSLKCLAKFAVRSYLFGRKSELGMDLPTLIESLDIPSTLTDELLFVSYEDKVQKVAKSEVEVMSDDQHLDVGFGLFD